MSRPALESEALLAAGAAPAGARPLSVVIPTYNECENLRILIPNIQRVFEQNGLDGEIVIVDDNSTDGSKELLEEFAQHSPNVVVRVRSGPPSIARAWFEGFELASKKNVVCIDGDLCHDPNEFPAMLDRLESHDLVIGSRYLDHLARMKDKSLLASWVSFLGQFITRTVTGFTETDTSHSFRMFKKSVFDTIKGQLKNEGNVFLIEFLIHAKSKGFRVTEIPIQYGKRIHGQTKLSVFREGVRYLRYIATVVRMRSRS